MTMSLVNLVSASMPADRMAMGPSNSDADPVDSSCFAAVSSITINLKISAKSLLAMMLVLMARG